MLTVSELARAAIDATRDDPEGTLLTIEKVLRLLDSSSSRNSHLANPLNHPRRGYVRPRSVLLDGSEPVYGDFLVLVHCEHDPFVRLDEYDDLVSMEAALASGSGIVNPFITYAVAFIRGRVRRYVVAYERSDGAVERFDKAAQSLQGPQSAEQAAKRWVEWSGA